MSNEEINKQILDNNNITTIDDLNPIKNLLEQKTQIYQNTDIDALINIINLTIEIKDKNNIKKCELIKQIKQEIIKTELYIKNDSYDPEIVTNNNIITKILNIINYIIFDIEENIDNTSKQNDIKTSNENTIQYLYSKQNDFNLIEYFKDYKSQYSDNIINILNILKSYKIENSKDNSKDNKINIIKKFDIEYNLINDYKISFIDSATQFLDI